MKKKIIILICVILIIGIIASISIFTYLRYSDNNDIDTDNYKNTEELSTVLTLEDKIQDDTIWCGTFQLLWNDLKNDLAKQDIVFSPQLEVIENLNKETFTVDDLSEKYYYKKIGTPSIELKQEIENAIKDKFNETSEILDDFDWNTKILKIISYM